MPDRLGNFARGTALLTGVLLLALLVAVAIVRLPPIQRWTAERVSARLPAGVSIERARLTLLPPGVRLANVSLAADGPTVKTVSCHARLAALLAGRIEIATVDVEGADITVERAADGSVHIAGALAPLGTTAGGAAPAAAPELSLAALPAVTVDNASLTFVDRTARGGPRTLQLTDGQLTLGSATPSGVPFTLAARLDPGGQVSAQGSVRPVPSADGGPSDHAIDATVTANRLDAQAVLSYLAAIAPAGGSARAEGTLDGSLTLSGSLAAGLAGDAALAQSSGWLDWDQVRLTAPLKLTAHLIASGDGIALSSGQLTIAQLAAARISASDLDAAFAYAARTLRLTSVRATAYGGTWTQSGTVMLTAPPNFDITLRADGVACDALLTAVTGEHPQYGCERFSADAALLGEWTGASSVARGAEGTGHIDMRGGTIPSSSIIGAVWQAFVPLIHTGKEPGALGAPSRVDHLTQSFALHAGRMHTTDLALVTDDCTVTGSGTVGLDGSLNLDTEVALTAAGVTKLLTMASLPIPGELGTLPSIPTRITGSVGDPIIRPEVEDLPEAAVQTLFEGARGAGEVLEGAAGSGVRALKRGLEKAW